MNMVQEIQKVFKGEIDDTEATRTLYSHDASLFEIKPQVVVFPKDSSDLQSLVKWVVKNKPNSPDLSITARSGGTCMSGGAINESIIVDFNRHFVQVREITPTLGHVQPGVFYRDFDKATREQGVIMPTYPASRELCTVGGMVANNSGGEKSLEYGKTANFVMELKVIFADGNEYMVRPLNHDELQAKMRQKDFEGELYHKLYQLLEAHYDEIKAARPQVSKDSTGYHLWDVWDRNTGIFDLTKLIVGSQGTLGFVTDIKFKLVPKPEHSGLLVCFLKDMSKLGEIINVVLETKPASFESFDDNTLWLSFKFFPAFLKRLGFVRWIKLAFQLIPDFFMLFRGIPKLILMVEYNGSSEDEVEQKIIALREKLEPYGMAMEKDENEFKSQKFWIMRRESFNLLRQKVKDKHTAPFIDDLVVQPKYLPEFLPQLRVIIKKYKLLATIAGHMGDGNFHIIPLMKIEEQSERNKLKPAMKEVNELVLKYKGSLSGEHNDGLVRGPWLEQMYGTEIVGYFREVKDIFDPQGIFNPHKKANADWDYSMSHIRKQF